MEIEEYRKQFIDDIRNDASLEGSDPESYFIERSLTDLENKKYKKTDTFF